MAERDPMKEPMLVKFRRKFIVTNMVFVATVLVIVGIAGSYNNYIQQERAVYNALNHAITLDGQEDVGPAGELGGSTPPSDAPPVLPSGEKADDGLEATGSNTSGNAGSNAGGNAGSSAAADAEDGSDESASDADSLSDSEDNAEDAASVPDSENSASVPNSEGAAEVAETESDSGNVSNDVMTLGSTDSDNQSEPDPDEAPRLGSDDMFVATSVYNVSPDLVVTTHNDSLSLSSDTVQKALTIVVDDAKESESGEVKGLIPSLNLYYQAQVTEDGTVIVAFASGYYVRHSVISLLKSLALPFVVALVGFFIVSLLLSRWSVGPVARAWQQQRQFVADASHELKTPLAVIMANNSILASDPEATVESQMQWVESTETEAHLMQGLVNDMLYLAQAESGSRDVELVEIDFSEVVQGSVLQFESVAFERGVFIEDEIQRNVKVYADPAQLKRLVGTLVDNACKYADDGGLVKVQLTRNGSKCRLNVINSGSPIDPEDLPHLFDRFYRSDKARTRGTGGFGLGLSIAKGIVDGMDGSISATSSEADGTCFTVVLPTA